MLTTKIRCHKTSLVLKQQGLNRGSGVTMERKHESNPRLSTTVSAVPRRSCQAPIHLHSTWLPAAGMARSSKKKKTTFFCLKPENKKSSATRCHFTLIWRSQYAGLALQFLRFLPGTISGCSNRTLGPVQLIFLCFFMEGKKLLVCRIAKLSVKHLSAPSMDLLSAQRQRSHLPGT